MSFLKKLFNKDETAENGGQLVYPGDNISLLRFGNEDEGFTTGWVNKAYVNYKQRSKTPYSCSMVIDLTDEIAENDEDLEMFSIEMYLKEELRKFGIVHFIARRATEYGMDLLMYVENDKLMSEKLDVMKNNSKRMFSFDYELEYDVEWDLAKDILSV